MISAAGFFLGLTLAAGPPELRQRFDEALSAEQRGDATACLAKLNEVTRALGRATLRVQPILVRCLTMAGGRDQQVLGEVAAYRRLSPDPALAETIDVFALEDAAKGRLQRAAEQERLKKDAAIRAQQLEKERLLREQRERDQLAKQQLEGQRRARAAEIADLQNTVESQEAIAAQLKASRGGTCGWAVGSVVLTVVAGAGAAAAAVFSLVNLTSSNRTMSKVPGFVGLGVMTGLTALASYLAFNVVGDQSRRCEDAKQGADAARRQADAARARLLQLQSGGAF